MLVARIIQSIDCCPLVANLLYLYDIISDLGSIFVFTYVNRLVNNIHLVRLYIGIACTVCDATRYGNAVKS